MCKGLELNQTERGGGQCRSRQHRVVGEAAKIEVRWWCRHPGSSRPQRFACPEESRHYRYPESEQPLGKEKSGVPKVRYLGVSGTYLRYSGVL